MSLTIDAYIGGALVVDGVVERPIPIHKFFGVGKVTEATLRHLGILTRADLKQLSEERLRILFGERGSLLYRYMRGEDDRPVEPMRVRKSVGKEVTLAQDINDPDRMLQILEQLAEQVERRLTELDLQGKTITLKLRWNDFRLMTRSPTVPGGVRDAHTMTPHLCSLLATLDLDQQPVRLPRIGFESPRLCKRGMKNPLPADRTPCKM